MSEPAPELVEAFVMAAHGNFDRVRELYDAQPELLNISFARFNETALEAAGHTGRRDIAEYLLDKGAPLTVFAAASLGRTEDVATWLRVDPTLAATRGVHNITLLYHAALGGKVEMVEMLVANGADPAEDAAVHAATKFGHRDVVAYLLERGPGRMG